MTTTGRPRRPLPPRVYWTRRLLVLGLALALVFGIARLLGTHGGGDPGGVAAQQVGARAAAASSSAPVTPSAAGSATAAPRVESPTKRTQSKKAPAKPVQTPLAVPTGPCADSDIRVEPSVDSDVYAGSDVAITLNLTTVDSPACTWQVSPRSVVLKVTSGSDRFWSTQDCPDSIAPESVVIRSGQQTKVYVTWDGQRADAECAKIGWAEPGYYHAEAAALGSEPADKQFVLRTPVRATITPTPKPHKKHAKAH